MKPRTLTYITTMTLLAMLATPVWLGAQAGPQHAPPRQRYSVTDLGTLPGGTFSQGTFVTNNGLVTGLSTTADGSQHAFLWYRGVKLDIGKRAFSGPNSGAIGVNVWGQVAGQAESSEIDPNNENFCAYFTGFKCLPFLWQRGVMTQLPLLGGNNGTVAPPNNRGEVPGVAETGTRDPGCPSAVAVNGTGPQVLDFEPVVWEPKRGQIRKLRTLPGDTVGIAAWINDNGQAVGTTGSCADTLVPPFEVGPHAVLWDKDGSVHDLGNLGGTANTALLGVGNIALAINNREQVTGVSALPGNVNTHAFLWTKEKGMQDLSTLPGDALSAGLGMNNLGDIVGASIDGDLATGNPRAVLWHNGVIADLNALVPNSPMYLLTAFAINDVGQIVGFGVNNAGEVHGFLATPKY
jgi:probable HAF family extracellular repeat protein